MSREIFTQKVRIAPDDIDMLGHVNNIVYLRWAQDIAVAHWMARAAPEMVAAYVWVVARHEVDYRAPLQLGDEIEARTWVADAAEGAKWARFVEIGKIGASRPAASIKTQWCLLNANTRRVMRVPDAIIERFAPQN